MQTVHQLLLETDDAVLYTIAAAWGIKSPSKQPDTLREDLQDTLLNADNAERMWESLTDEQRQSLQTLLGSRGQMPMSMFKRLFGEIRRMGRGQIEREEPHKNPESAAEALFYRGLIGEAFILGDSGTQAFAYVPDDMVLVLPTHKTAYDNIESPPQEPVASFDVNDVNEPRAADTSIVDDFTTLLAFLRLYGPPIDGDTIAADSLDALMPYLLVPSPPRAAFMMMVGITTSLIDVQNGRAYPHATEARRWLAASRADQLEAMIAGWYESSLYMELWHVADLTVERVDNYDPSLARRTLFDTMYNVVPESDWWDIDEFIYLIKQQNPDFQRPNGDYDSWYIMDSGGEYIRGFESWDTVEAVQIEFLINGPMHWLGLLDIAPEAARLTGYGRGAIGRSQFPKPPDSPEPTIVQDDGTLLLSRRASRMDRYQVARFTSWQSAPSLDSGDPYTYLLDLKGVHQADAQGINTGHITTFIKRVLGDDPIPERIEKLLQNWNKGDTATVTMEQMVVLRTTSEQMIEMILNTPELRRYLGARLGPLAVAVRANQAEALQAALADMAIDVSGLG